MISILLLTYGMSCLNNILEQKFNTSKLWSTLKVVMIGKFMSLHVYIRKEEKSKLELQKPKKRKASDSQSNQKK